MVLSVASGDPDGLPQQEMLEALKGYQLLRTDYNGWISIATDGEQMRVGVEKEGMPVDKEVKVETQQPPLPRLQNELKRETENPEVKVETQQPPLPRLQNELKRETENP